MLRAPLHSASKVRQHNQEVSGQNNYGWAIGGAFVCIGLLGLGWQGARAALQFKKLDRSITVKGLAEKEVPADVVIWPIEFTIPDNDLESLYQKTESQTQKVYRFLQDRGITAPEISTWPPEITDKAAHRYGDGRGIEFRYVASQSVTVYSQKIKAVRAAIKDLPKLGKEGVALSANQRFGQAEYMFTGLNKIKPGMIEQATKKAREVANKFAQDSESQLGQIKRASQGRFSINDRDSSTPHIKKVRVVSTITYYLDD